MNDWIFTFSSSIAWHEGIPYNFLSSFSSSTLVTKHLRCVHYSSHRRRCPQSLQSLVVSRRHFVGEKKGMRTRSINLQLVGSFVQRSLVEWEFEGLRHVEQILQSSSFVSWNSPTVAVDLPWSSSTQHISSALQRIENQRRMPSQVCTTADSGEKKRDETKRRRNWIFSFHFTLFVTFSLNQNRFTFCFSFLCFFSVLLFV